MVDIDPSGVRLVLFAPSGSKTFICVDFFSPHQRRNYNYVDSLKDTIDLPNPDQADPDLDIFLPLGVIDSTISQLILLNTDMFKTALQHNILVNV